MPRVVDVHSLEAQEDLWVRWQSRCCDCEVAQRVVHELVRIHADTAKWQRRGEALSKLLSFVKDDFGSAFMVATYASACLLATQRLSPLTTSARQVLIDCGFKEGQPTHQDLQTRSRLDDTLWAQAAPSPARFP